jgi:capsular polysaccharide biosynthesis protein
VEGLVVELKPVVIVWAPLVAAARAACTFEPDAAVDPFALDSTPAVRAKAFVLAALAVLAVAFEVTVDFAGLEESRAVAGACSSGFTPDMVGTLPLALRGFG